MVLWATSRTGAQTFLYPDMFPYVAAGASSQFQTLQAWQLAGSEIRFSTMFANQGDGLFEIRKGPNVSATRHQLLQRVYLNADFGSQFVDLPIGTAPIPGTAGSPDPFDLNVLWFEDFAKFSLHEAPIVGGALTVGAEVASTVKTSWRLSANRGPLPGFETAPSYASSNQTLQQRISVGWADMYSAGSTGQLINVAGIPVGPRYWLRQTVDPANRIQETDETNNSFEVLIDLSRPGEAVMFGGEFVQPGDAPPPTPGDLNEDGFINRDDWLAFKAGAETSLAGLSPLDAYLLGDLNFDGQHTLEDALLFRQHFDAANGAGSFAIASRVPEPAGLALLGAAGVAALALGRRVRRSGVARAAARCLAVCFAGALCVRAAWADVTLFHEDFEGLPLGPNVNETLANPNAWTQTPPSGWTVNDSGVPTVSVPSRGVKEWEGWSFANKAWWVAAAGDQNRGEFQLASGTVAVADPDEWDDRGAPASGSPFLGYYNALMRTPAISLTDAPAGAAQLTFASSWQPEGFDDGPARTNNQTAVVRAAFDGGPFSEIMRWDSNGAGAFFKPDATNELVTLNLNNAPAAQSVVLEFGLLNAGNDWWWAIDNVAVVVPTTLHVDVVTGEMTLVGAADLAGYEITSLLDGLDPATWRVDNLDARNVGSPTPATADFTHDNVVEGRDLLAWQRRFGAPAATHADGDADGDRDVDGVDFGQWAAQFATTVPAGDSWETLIDSKSHLLEYFLADSSDGASLSIGRGFDVVKNARDLEFRYADSSGLMRSGPVIYNGPAVTPAAVPVPEPAAALGAWLGALGLAARATTARAAGDAREPARR